MTSKIIPAEYDEIQPGSDEFEAGPPLELWLRVDPEDRHPDSFEVLP